MKEQYAETFLNYQWLVQIVKPSIYILSDVVKNLTGLGAKWTIQLQIFIAPILFPD